MLGETSGPRTDLQNAMKAIADNGCGVVVILREMATNNLSDMIARRLNPQEQVNDLRDYGIGAQILKDLDVRQMILLSNSQPNIVSLDGHGLEIKGWQALES